LSSGKTPPVGLRGSSCGLREGISLEVRPTSLDQSGSANPTDFTGLLRRWAAGDAEAFDQAFALAYERMRRLAHQHLRQEPDGSLNTTALVHETYLALADSPQVSARDRGHFLGLISRVMRHLLVDHARARKAAKRGLGAAPAPLDDILGLAEEQLEDITDLHEALQRLEAIDERRARILEQRYFGGLSLEETAQAVGVSLATVKRELRSARAWLALQLGRDVA
jgi:RNA polymerase sigma factor (TIGR02999 family)